MAGFAGIAATGKSIERLLNAAFAEEEPVPGKKTRAVLVRTSDFEETNAATNIGSPALSVFLYRVDPNKVMRAAWSAVGSLDGTAHFAVDLHFILTPWADNAEFEQRILGKAMQCLETTPLLSGPLLHPSADWAAGKAPSRSSEFADCVCSSGGDKLDATDPASGRYYPELEQGDRRPTPSG